VHKSLRRGTFATHKMAETQLSVLFTSSWYPSPKDAVLGNFVRRHAESVATKHNVWAIYITSFPSDGKYSKINYTYINGVHTVIGYYEKKGFSLLRRWRAFQEAVRFVHDKKGGNFDVVHHNMTWPDGWQALYLKYKFGLPFIVSENWTGFDDDERGYPERKVVILSRQVAHASAFLCPVSENLANSMRKLGLSKDRKDKYRIVANVVDTDLFVPSSNKSLNTFHYLHVSSLLDQHKNISGLLRVWKVFSEKNPDVCLTIAGDGEISKHIAYAEDLNIRKGSILFSGILSANEVAQEMRNAHAFVLFSNYENLPCVILEAMSAGIPVIATDVGGVREHLFPERGYLILKRDESALLSSLQLCKDEYSKFDSDAIRKYAVREFSVKRIEEKFTEIYLDAIQGKQ